MKFGIYLDLRNPDNETPWPQHYADALEHCERAEALGADSVWLSEHHGFPDGYLPQPLTFAAAIAARTRRIRIGTAVLLLPLRHPVHLAEEAAVVDIVSGGRLDLGLGAGYRDDEFDLFGTPKPKSQRAFFDRISELDEVLASGRTTPHPAQSPIPMWLGLNGPLGARRAGRLGKPLLSVRRSLFEEYREGLIEGGVDPAQARMSGPVNIFLSDNPDRDADAVKAGYAYLWESYAASNAERGDVPAQIDMSRAVAKGLAGGLNGLVITTAEDAAKLLAEYFDGIPIDTVFTWSRIPRIPQPLMERHLELWCSALPAIYQDRIEKG